MSRQSITKCYNTVRNDNMKENKVLVKIEHKNMQITVINVYSLQADLFQPNSYRNIQSDSYLAHAHSQKIIETLW